MSEDNVQMRGSDRGGWIVLAVLLIAGLIAYFLYAPRVHPAHAGRRPRRRRRDDPADAAGRQSFAKSHRARPRARWPSRSGPASPGRRSPRGSMARSAISTGPLEADATVSPSSPTGTRTPSRCCATRRPTSWPRRCASSSRGRRSGSARRSRTASTTTSRSERPFTPEDLETIEKKMAEVAAKDYPFVREEVDRDEANRRFKDDPLKLERIADLGADEMIYGLHRRPLRGPLPRPPRARAPPGSSISSCSLRPAPTGGATRDARCCSGSTAPPGSRRRTSRPTSTGWRRPASATTGSWARSSTSSSFITSRPGRRSGPTAAPASTTP